MPTYFRQSVFLLNMETPLKKLIMYLLSKVSKNLHGNFMQALVLHTLVKSPAQGNKGGRCVHCLAGEDGGRRRSNHDSGTLMQGEYTNQRLFMIASIVASEWPISKPQPLSPTLNLCMLHLVTKEKKFFSSAPPPISGLQLGGQGFPMDGGNNSGGELYTQLYRLRCLDKSRLC